MTIDIYKKEFAEAVAKGFRTAYAETFEKSPDNPVFSGAATYEALKAPKDASMGQFALPVFRYAKLFGGPPPQIAARVATATIWANGTTSDVSGFVNGRIEPDRLAFSTLQAILTDQSNFGASDTGKGQTCLVEYSSPNIAKPFGIGHLRSTIIGHSLRRIYKKIGYDAIGINYPGDWGTQFGKMIVAYEKWGDDQTLKGEAVKNLLSLYVRFHKEAHENEALNDEARLAFKRLEDGDEQAVKLWDEFKSVSYAEFDRIYGLLGIEFDLTYGESLLNDKMEPLIERLERAGLTSVSRGALIVELDDEQLPPLLLKKTDGATLYATRDLAGMAYRWSEYPGFAASLFIVNVAQSDHFKQCFKAIALLEAAEDLPADQRMSGRLKHIDFGWVKFKGQMMSTRQGNTVLLEDVVDEATNRVGEIIHEKNPDLANAQETAQLIGVGAVIFSQLSVKRQTDVDFRWEEVLNFEGETGPYLQYTHARLCSLMRKYAQNVTPDIDYALLNRAEEQRVLTLLAEFPGAISHAARNYEPYFIARHLLTLSAAFNTFYQRKDASGRLEKIISEDAQLSAARIALVGAVQVVIKEGLFLLGLEAPQEM